MKNKNDVQYKFNEKSEDEEGKIPPNTRNDKIMEKKLWERFESSQKNFPSLLTETRQLKNSRGSFRSEIIS